MEVYAQVCSFFVTIGIGMALGVMFDFYRTTRRFFRLKKTMTVFFDGLYWLCAIIVAFVCLLYSNWAQMRFYVFFGIISGAIFYYRFISFYLLAFLFKIFQIGFATQLKIKIAIVNYFVRPLGYLLGVFLFPFRYGKQKVKYLGKQVKNRIITGKK